MKKAFVVLGLGYGDEGKGLTTDFLCANQKSPLVIRFNGGQQAGHTVVTAKGKRHVFSNFGSGVFRNVPTYWSSFCTFSPAYFLEELKLLPVNPKIYLDNSCPVTTHYDVLYNRALEISRGELRYGSCGVGFGATVDRHKKVAVKLTVGDLFDEDLLKKKLERIRKFYQLKMKGETGFDFTLFDHDAEDIQLLKDVRELRGLIKSRIVTLTTAAKIFKMAAWSTYIFEGAQGILLDQKFGVKPYITKSNTTSKNALYLIEQYIGLPLEAVTIVYVTRCYQTRHGYGPVLQKSTVLKLNNTQKETNKKNDFQGEFKTGPLNADLLNYSIKCDRKFSKKCGNMLVVTCLDQLEKMRIPVIEFGKIKYIKFQNIPILIKELIQEIKYSFNACSDKLR